MPNVDLSNIPGILGSLPGQNPYTLPTQQPLQMVPLANNQTYTPEAQGVLDYSMDPFGGAFGSGPQTYSPEAQAYMDAMNAYSSGIASRGFQALPPNMWGPASPSDIDLANVMGNIDRSGGLTNEAVLDLIARGVDPTDPALTTFTLGFHDPREGQNEMFGTLYNVTPDTQYRLVSDRGINDLGISKGDVVGTYTGFDVANAREDAMRLRDPRYQNPETAAWHLEQLNPATGEWRDAGVTDVKNTPGFIGTFAPLLVGGAIGLGTGFGLGPLIGPVGAGAAGGGLSGFVSSRGDLEAALTGAVMGGAGALGGRFLGPLVQKTAEGVTTTLGTAVGTGLGTTAGSLVTGSKLKDAIINGVASGALSYVSGELFNNATGKPVTDGELAELQRAFDAEFGTSSGSSGFTPQTGGVVSGLSDAITVVGNVARGNVVNGLIAAGMGAAAANAAADRIIAQAEDASGVSDPDTGEILVDASLVDDLAYDAIADFGVNETGPGGSSGGGTNAVSGSSGFTPETGITVAANTAAPPPAGGFGVNVTGTGGSSGRVDPDTGYIIVETNSPTTELTDSTFTPPGVIDWSSFRPSEASGADRLQELQEQQEPEDAADNEEIIVEALRNGMTPEQLAAMGFGAAAIAAAAATLSSGAGAGAAGSTTGSTTGGAATGGAATAAAAGLTGIPLLDDILKYLTLAGLAGDVVGGVLGGGGGGGGGGGTGTGTPYTSTLGAIPQFTRGPLVPYDGDYETYATRPEHQFFRPLVA